MANNIPQRWHLRGCSAHAFWEVRRDGDLWGVGVVGVDGAFTLMLNGLSSERAAAQWAMDFYLAANRTRTDSIAAMINGTSGMVS